MSGSSRLTQSTLIPIGVAVAVIGGGAVWGTTVQFRLQAGAEASTEIIKKVDRVEGKQDAYLEEIQKVRLELEGIRWEMKRFKK